MNTFKKHFTDKEGSFKVGYYYNSEFQKYVNSDKPLYLEWLSDGNTPEEIAYVPPTPLTQEQLTNNAITTATQIAKTTFQNRTWEASSEYTALQTEVIGINTKTISELKEV